MSKILTRQQIDFWHENGYLEPVRFAPEDEMTGYVARLEDFERDYPEHVPKLDVKAHLLCGWANELVQNPVLLDVMEDLLGPNLLLTGAAFRIKPPDGRTFAEWHQDSYVAAIKPFFCTATLALSEYSAENGCLRVIPGSHRWGALPMSDTGDEDSILSRPYRVTSEFDEAQAVDVVMRPGELTLQHDHTIHGSRPNRSMARRIGLLADFTTPDARKGVRRAGVGDPGARRRRLRELAHRRDARRGVGRGGARGLGAGGGCLCLQLLPRQRHCAEGIPVTGRRQ